MFCTIINDCKDANAFGRQSTRVASLLSCPITTIGVSSDIEAAGNLIDALDASEGREGFILVNVAPRDGASKKGGNGSPFALFSYHKTQVISSVEGYTLSLVKKLLPQSHLQIISFEKIVSLFSDLDEAGKIRIATTQFRSFEFLPRIACLLAQSVVDLPTTPLAWDTIQDISPTIWWVDNFGNCKTTLTNQDIEVETTKIISFPFGELPFYLRLKDVPDNITACVIGSSGINNIRLLEIVVQGGSATQTLNIGIRNRL